MLGEDEYNSAAIAVLVLAAPQKPERLAALTTISQLAVIPGIRRWWCYMNVYNLYDLTRFNGCEKGVVGCNRIQQR
ncbi:unnamed protein product [Peronospora destructor]|uniref:Uncharacterized protein n=1 Tax=Peronospora destructor TaxID=86335 RepID=A0AAV0UPU7_9STRA|nr:unnamed protein product [Peronospora destructor]